MIFDPTSIPGVFVISVEERADERGFFARAFCSREFAAAGLASAFVQCNISFNPGRGTLRGMHFQTPPAEEVKLVRCTRGAAIDVVVDLRAGSPTHRRWIGVEITAENRRAVYVPKGCAHGYQTLVDDTEIFYLVSEFYSPELSSGVRWNDPAFGIEWPIAAAIISERDRSAADYTG